MTLLSKSHLVLQQRASKFLLISNEFLVINSFPLTMRMICARREIQWLHRNSEFLIISWRIFETDNVLFLFPKQSERWKISKIAMLESFFLFTNFPSILFLLLWLHCPCASASRNSPFEAASLQTRNYSHLIPNAPRDKKRTYYPSRQCTKTPPSRQTPSPWDR